MDDDPNRMSDEITDAQVDAALAVPYEEGVGLPYGARVANYVTPDSQGDERAQQLAALIRRALQAAKEVNDG